MTNLTGTEKQIEWAEKIRKGAAEHTPAIIAKAKHPAVGQFIERMMSQASAAWWIDHRDHFASFDTTIGFVAMSIRKEMGK